MCPSFPGGYWPRRNSVETDHRRPLSEILAAPRGCRRSDRVRRSSLTDLWGEGEPRGEQSHRFTRKHLEREAVAVLVHVEPGTRMTCMDGFDSWGRHVEFGRSNIGVAVGPTLTPGNQNPAVEQKSRCMKGARNVETRGAYPRIGDPIVDLRRTEKWERISLSAGEKNPPIEQQRCRVEDAQSIRVGGTFPQSGRRIVKLRKISNRRAPCRPEVLWRFPRTWRMPSYWYGLHVPVTGS